MWSKVNEDDESNELQDNDDQQLSLSINPSSSSPSSPNHNIDENSDSDSVATPLWATYLYVAHFVSTWGERMWEYGNVVFIFYVFPDSLMPLAVAGLYLSHLLSLISHVVYYISQYVSSA